MLVAYFDASRTGKGRPYVTVAGCLAHLDQWKLFQPEWQRMLDEEGLRFFHMTDFEAYEGAYKEWSRKRHETCLQKIADVIVPRTKFAFARGVADDDFDFAKTQNEVLQPWSAFTYCASQCLHGIAHSASNHGHEGPIIYVFESGDGFKGELLSLAESIENSKERRMRYRWNGLHILPKIANDPPYPLTPLQAADIWAFEARKEWENKYAVGERTHPLRRSVRMLLEGTGVEHDFGFSPRENLVNLEPYWLTS
jgi:hypothetical protein